ncbi:MAG: T9SS C-terminal target domain-containing protein, partial [Cruoricaptor ignavus]|nr:T9SS C-terminal target domain-containing protein [Cruoricaptor ignavus]
MKKLLFFIIFFFAFFNFYKVEAQSFRESAHTSQKSDDGVLVAYPNPAKDFIVVKTKDTSLKIKSVTFYSILGMEVATYNVNMNSG